MKPLWGSVEINQLKIDVENETIRTTKSTKENKIALSIKVPNILSIENMV